MMVDYNPAATGTSKRRTELKPGDGFVFMRAGMDPAVPLKIGTVFTNERGTFRIVNLASEAIETIYEPQPT